MNNFLHCSDPMANLYIKYGTAIIFHKFRKPRPRQQNILQIMDKYLNDSGNTDKRSNRLYRSVQDDYKSHSYRDRQGMRVILIVVDSESQNRALSKPHSEVKLSQNKVPNSKDNVFERLNKAEPNLKRYEQILKNGTK